MGASISAYLEGRTLGNAGIVDELEPDSTKEQSRSSREARLLAGTTAGGERHAATHSSWSGERSLEAELEYQSTLASLALVEEPEPVCVGHDGRYAIRRLIGRGAMGAVYFADDLALRRPVAIKVVSKIVGDRQHFQDRLRREAWALALLDHPNVLQVYDVDLAASGELFIVMQYVAGRTLREWAEAEQPSREQLLEVFVAAGRGLAAAHGKGLVHRDFKPDNVLIRDAGAQGLAGRVLVADFGLAGGAALELGVGELSGPTPVELEALPVHTARFLGTPAYMSPEQRRCEALDARSDQFSFCTSMWELMLGERPLGALVERRPRELAPWLYQLMRRGLAAHPEGRYPSMGELLDELEHTPARRRRWRSLVGAAVLGGGLALGVGLALGGGAEPSAALPDPCGELDAPLDELWTPQRRAALGDRLAGLELADAGELAARTMGLLDSAAARWSEDRRQSCRAAPLRESACHARWLERFDRRVTLIEGLEPAQAGRAMSLVEPLLTNSICDAPPVPLAPELQAQLDRAEDAALLADYERAIAEAEQAYAQAAELPGCAGGNYSLERAAAAYRLGDIYGELDEGARALDWLQQAARHARACADNDRLLAAQLRAIKIQAVDLRELDDAAQALLDAESLAARGSPRGELAWELPLTRGLVALERGEHAEAQRWLDHALGLPELVEQPLLASEALLNLGVSVYRAGQPAQAMAHFDEAEERIRQTYGALVPELDLLAFNRAALLLEGRELDQARALLEPLRDSPHPKARLLALTALAQIFAESGEAEAMRESAGQLRALLEQHPDLPPFERALGLYWAGQILADGGDPAGLQALRDALTLFERVGPGREERDDCQLSLAWNLLELGQLEDAQAELKALQERDLSARTKGLLPQLSAELEEKLSAG